MVVVRPIYNQNAAQLLEVSPMKISGIKHGNTIELSENYNIPDGTQMIIEVKQVDTMTIE